MLTIVLGLENRVEQLEFALLQQSAIIQKLDDKILKLKSKLNKSSRK